MTSSSSKSKARSCSWAFLKGTCSSMYPPSPTATSLIEKRFFFRKPKFYMYLCTVCVYFSRENFNTYLPASQVEQILYVLYEVTYKRKISYVRIYPSRADPLVMYFLFKNISILSLCTPQGKIFFFKYIYLTFKSNLFQPLKLLFMRIMPTIFSYYSFYCSEYLCSRQFC
jgi:hypothetical protein